ncbi:MAG: UvrD-helicase domain-containing protein [Verrucomicrobia bacterium]|nr:UvrD-helicase domain-containing protein [Verrucomicrobiota bacterium]
MALWAAKKGVTVLGTGDFTHPAWFAEIKEKLVAAEPGLFRLRPEFERWVERQFPAFAQQPTRFLLEVEISTIYKKGERTRKVHHLHYVPDLAAAERFIGRLSRVGNLKADGRPILGLDSRDLLEMTLEAGEGAYLIPAHIWTPWFAVLGSKSGFDSVEECYSDLTRHIFALETGLSSDPPMNWRLSQLDRFQLVSNSDAHSPGKIGREACCFECALDYWAIRHALETGHGYGGTVEFFPEEGKYHLDGHRACGVCFEPEETKKHGGLCPACGKELTVGVMHRVAELADRSDGLSRGQTAAFRRLIPLPEVLAEINRVGVSSRKVSDNHEKLLRSLGSELFILERAPVEDLRKAGSTLLAEGIARMREGRVIRQAGYDGEYGVIRVFTDDELRQGNSVGVLFDVPTCPTGKGRAVPPHPGPLPTGERVSSAADGETATVGKNAMRAKVLPLPWGEGRGEGESDTHQPSCLSLAESAPNLPFVCDPLGDLDPEQRRAAELTDGALLIVAGPGTGKTRTLTHRICHLVTHQLVPAAQCLAVTFTHRAANEMKERLRNLIPLAAEEVLVTTFHGLGYRVLQEHATRLGFPKSFRIANEAERRALLAEKLDVAGRNADRCLRRLSGLKRTHAPEGGRAFEYVGQASSLPVHGASLPRISSGRAPPQPAAKLADTIPNEAQLLLSSYNRAMRERGWLDFDDLLCLSVELLETQAEVLAELRERFRWISVDEFQDIDELQYRFIRLLVPASGNLCVIGDPDQSIYSFRGADPRFFQRFAADYPGARTVQLRRNYRSGQAIVRGALQAITPATLVEGRVLEALHTDPTRIVFHESPTDKAEAEFVVHTVEKLIGGHAFFSLDSGRVEGSASGGGYSFSDFAVLYRMETQADALCEALARSGIPFQRHAHAPLCDHPVVQALVLAAREMAPDRSVLDRLKAASSDHASSRSAATSFPALLSSFEPLAVRCGFDFARFESELALLSDADLWDARADRVSLLTLHASKGLEFAVVFLVGCEDGMLPLCFGSEDDADLEEERRLFFVGMTRARERLILSHARRRLWRGSVQQQTVSPFLAAIQEELLERTRSELKPRERPAGVQLDLFG